MDSIISYVIGPKCYRTFFMEGDFMDVPCLKYSISKGLGYGSFMMADPTTIP